MLNKFYRSVFGLPFFINVSRVKLLCSTTLFPKFFPTSSPERSGGRVGENSGNKVDRRLLYGVECPAQPEIGQ